MKWHRWSEHEEMLKGERLQLSGGLLCLTVAPRRDLGTAVGDLIALIRSDGHVKDSVSDWDMLALFYIHSACHGIEQLHSSLKFSCLKIAQHKKGSYFQLVWISIAMWIKRAEVISTSWEFLNF